MGHVKFVTSPATYMNGSGEVCDITCHTYEWVHERISHITSRIANRWYRLNVQHDPNIAHTNESGRVANELYQLYVRHYPHTNKLGRIANESCHSYWTYKWITHKHKSCHKWVVSCTSEWQGVSKNVSRIQMSHVIFTSDVSRTYI